MVDKLLTDTASGSDILAQGKEEPNITDSGVGTDSLVIDKELSISESATGGDALVAGRLSLPTESRERTRLKPIYLVEVSLLNGGGILYLSDRNITIGSQIYETYILSVTGITEEVRRNDSTFLNADVSIVFSNEKYKTNNYLIELGDTYPFIGAECTIREVHLDDNDAVIKNEIVIKGVLDEPANINLLSFECTFSSLSFYKDKTWEQKIINDKDYPEAYEDLGKYEPIIYGSDIKIPCPKIDWGARTTLKESIPDGTTGAFYEIELSDTSRFRFGSGSIYIGKEKISFGYINDNKLYGIVRGIDNTTATAHNAGATVWEVRPYYKSLIAGHNVKSVGDIYAEIGGKLLRVTEGVSTEYVGGKTILKASEQIRVDVTDVKVTQSTSLYTIKREATNCPYQTVTGTVGFVINFPSCPVPLNTLSDVKIVISWKIIKTEDTGDSVIAHWDGGADTHKRIAEIDGSETINWQSGTFEISQSSWQTVQHFYISGAKTDRSKVKFTVYNCYITAKSTAKDPSGGRFTQIALATTNPIPIVNIGGEGSMVIYFDQKGILFPNRFEAVEDDYVEVTWKAVIKNDPSFASQITLHWDSRDTSKIICIITPGGGC